jgi:hypothetical protein
LTGDDLLRTLDKMSEAASPAGTPKAESSNIDWPKRVLRQTILVSSIAAEIEVDTGRANWDKSCYEECRKLLQLEISWLGDIYENQGAEEIPVLVDWEVQRWIAEALEGAKRTSSLAGDRIAQIGAQCTSRDGRRGRDKQSGPSAAARKARQAVLDATRVDSQLERLVRLALGKKACPEARCGKAVVPVLLEAPVGQGVLDKWPYCTIDGCASHIMGSCMRFLRRGSLWCRRRQQRRRSSRRWRCVRSRLRQCT